MSIILNALKKVQNQEAAETSGRVAASELGENSASGAAMEQASPDSMMEVDSGRGGDSSFAVMRIPVGRQTGSASDSAVEHHRFGRIPKILLGLILALGIFTTGWFVSRLYFDFGPSENEEATSLQTSTVQPQRVAHVAEVTPPDGQRAAVSVQSPAVTDMAPAPAAPVAAVTPALPDQPAEASAVEFSPQPIKSEARETRPKNGIAERRSVRSEEIRTSEKEAKPQKAGRPDLKINAIAWRSEEPKAIVNMQRVYVGDVIDGAKVTAIQRNSIIFEYGGETFEVRF